MAGNEGGDVTGAGRGEAGRAEPGDKTPPKPRTVRRSEQAASVDGHQIKDLVRHDDPRPAHKHPFAQEREVRRAIMSERDEVAIERRGTGSAVSSGTRSVMFQPRPAHAGLSSSPGLASSRLVANAFRWQNALFEKKAQIFKGLKGVGGLAADAAALKGLSAVCGSIRMAWGSRRYCRSDTVARPCAAGEW